MVCRFEPFVPMVVLVGATREAIKITAMCVSKPQLHWPNMELHCPCGNVSVMLLVCHTSLDLLSILKSNDGCQPLLLECFSSSLVDCYFSICGSS